MLASIPSHQSLPANSQGKDNSISESGNGEGFSEHLDAKPKSGPEMELPEATEIITQEPQLPMQDVALELDENFSVIEVIEEMVLDGDAGSMPLQQPPELLNSEKILSVLRFSHLANQQEMVVAQPADNKEMLAPTTEMDEEQLVTKTVPLVVNQGPIGGETNISIAPAQIAPIGNGIVRESKPVKEKSDKPVSTPTTLLQTPVAVKPAVVAQNTSFQADAMVQPKVDLPQEQNSSNDADLEKTVRSLDVKVNTAPVSADPSSAKLSVDGNVPSLSQPSQTLVRAIQENSNWTKVMNTSSVQLETTPKIDGTVLQKLDIHLNLTTIGKLDVKLRLQQGELQIQIRTDSEQAFKALSLDQDALANTIKGLGYKVDNIAISGPRPDSGFQMNSNAQAQSQHHSAEHQAQNGNSGQRTGRDFMPMKDADNEAPIPTSDVENSISNGDVI